MQHTLDMIREAKGMIAGCIEKMRKDACGGCERRDACAELFPFLLRSRRERPAAAARHPFLSFLGEVAKAMESKAAARRAAPRPNRFRSRVEQKLEASLESGDVGIDRIAREFGCSRQTLYRRLKAEGTTYEQLLDGLRRRLALRFVREQRLAVKDAAYRLGFSDPAAFSRAFKRWTGTSPSDMRTRH